MDIASLGFRIDSSQAVKAAKDLDRLHDQAKRAEKAVEKLDNQIRRMKDIPSAASRQVDGSLSREVSRPTSRDGAAGGADGSMERAAEDTRNIGKAAKVAADDMEKMRSQALELFTAVASGDASLGMFIEQGWKMGEIIMSSGSSLGAWAQALGLTNPIVLAVVAAIGVAVGAFAMFQSDLNKHAKDKAYLKSLGFTKDEIDKLGKTTVTAGDIFKGFWMTLNEGNRVTKVFDDVKKVAGDAFRQIVDGVGIVAAAIGGYYVAAFKTIAFMFSNFGGMVRDVFITSANFVIGAINWMLEKVVGSFSDLGQKLNKFFGKHLFDEMKAIQISPLKNDAEGKMKAFLGFATSARKEMDGIMKASEGIVRKIEINSYKSAMDDDGVPKAGGGAATAIAVATSGNCDCGPQTAYHAANENDPANAVAPVAQVETTLETIILQGKKALDGLVDAAGGAKEALHPLRDQIAGIGEDLSKSLGQAIVNGEDLGDVMTSTFKRIAAEWASQGIQKMFDGLIGKKGDAGTGILGGLFSSGGSGGSGDFLSKAASFLGGIFSFDGGGYTGEGSRNGGVDGKGGFLAVMHPRETVVDHTKGSGGGGGQAVQVAVSVTVDDDGKIRAYVRDSSARAVQTGISQYDAGMPQRVAAIGNDPRRR